MLNKAGGGGSVAYAYLQQRPGDAHAIVLSGAGRGGQHDHGTRNGPPGHHARRGDAAEYVGMAVRADSPFKSGRQLMDILKKDPQASRSAREQPRQRQSPGGRARDESAGIHPAKARIAVFQSGGHSTPRSWAAMCRWSRLRSGSGSSR